MGAGCYYTHDCNKTKAAWIDVSEIEQSRWDDTFWFEINDIFVGLGYKPDGQEVYKNGLFKVELRQYDNNLVIYIEPRYKYDEWGRSHYDRRYYLAMANHAKAENKIWKALQSADFELNIATSGYTSEVLGKIE